MTVRHYTFTATGGGQPALRCPEVTHGRHCRTVSWGYDPEHTDSPRPYTLAELADRPECPHRYAYPDHGQYLQGWSLWRALRRDRRLNEQEHKTYREGGLRHIIMGSDPADRPYMARRWGIEL